MTNNPRLIEACKKWDRLTELFRKLELYAYEDYKPLFCTIRGNKAEVVVGSSPGHKTHIDLDNKTLEYYDTDVEVNASMRKHLEDAGLSCNVMTGEGERALGVTCTGVNEKNVEEVFRKLAAATSMDIRAGMFEVKWDPATEKIWRKRPTDVVNEVCREFGHEIDEINDTCLSLTGGKCFDHAFDYCLTRKIMEREEELWKRLEK
jgi:hypothetical protein